VAERYLHFVRHGQYEPSPAGGTLTSLGRQQVHATAKRLAGVSPAVVHSSDLERAVESARIIADKSGARRARPDKRLREMTPTGLRGYTVPRAVRARGREDLDFIVSTFFRPSRRQRHEVFACHGNLIRALTCQALGVKLTRWIRMDIHNGAVTTFVVLRDGHIRLVSFNDIGHFRPSLLSEW
jgi:broad specificity phosphatase PhoE